MTSQNVNDQYFTPHLGFSGLPKAVVERITDFNNPRQQWRRLFSEVMGTFLLVLVAG